jgi:hypothetical protein
METQAASTRRRCVVGDFDGLACRVVTHAPHQMNLHILPHIYVMGCMCSNVYKSTENVKVRTHTHIPSNALLEMEISILFLVLFLAAKVV